MDEAMVAMGFRLVNWRTWRRGAVIVTEGENQTWGLFIRGRTEAWGRGTDKLKEALDLRGEKV